MTSGSESMGQEPRSASCSSTSNDSSNFECNICFDLAQDPIVTLCGHLFCWPCLYKWLQTRTQSQVCPVCNALIEEEKLVPLYGRGKTSTDPRSKSIPGSSIPHRPAGQRPQTAPTPEPNYFPDHSFGLMGGFDGFAPQTMPRFGNFAPPAAFGRFMPSLFNLHEHGFHNRAFFGVGTGYPHGFYSSFYGDHARVYYQRRRQQQQDAFLKKLLIGIGLCVLLVILFN